MTTPDFVARNADLPVTLENCADEPIHIPGSIQPHGAILVFSSAALLVSWSANAAAMLHLAAPLVLLTELDVLGLGAEVVEKIHECLDDMDGGEAPASMVESTVGQQDFDCIVHGHEGLVIVEYEARDQAADSVATFALKAHSAIDRLKRQKSVPALLKAVVDQVRLITGFDRVMAYRFRHDDSGEVAAEARDEALDPYLGRRYPASDIPSQARRLYVINTLRLIGDMGYAPVSMVGRTGAAPLDMSYCVLRSVSPIHVEYLRNMGVQASMSISIVINGKLWGLIACHHMAPRRVPYAIRMAADVMAQVLAASVQSLETRERAALTERAAEVRTQVMESLIHHDDVASGLTACAAEICTSLGASALVILHAGRVQVHGPVPAAVVAAAVLSITHEDSDIVERSARRDWPAEQQQACGKWVGLLGLRYDAAAGGWLLALREEQVELVRWAGKPDKVIAHGPLGPRLTPRGSFDEWRETVVDQAEPWETTRMSIARQLLAEMNRASVTRHEQNDRARAQLFAILGHDLRNPLQSISMAATVLELGGSKETAGRRIKASSGRMERLISQVLDMSMINGGMLLGTAAAEADLAPILADLADEFRTAKPNIVLHLEHPPQVLAAVDTDRLAQAISNLISNAYHHGKIGEPIHVRLAQDAGGVTLDVVNVGDEIAEDTARTLYNPFKRLSANNTRNKGGMGLGLYIARQIMVEHGGTIDYSYQAPHVRFTLYLPATPVVVT
jgi:light-regulated signal transduction histidine kinase (bacteriophytochrome)